MRCLSCFGSRPLTRIAQQLTKPRRIGSNCQNGFKKTLTDWTVFAYKCAFPNNSGWIKTYVPRLDAPPPAE